MKRQKFVISFLLVIIFLLALGVRLYRLGQSPESLTWDEAALGYNSYSLLKTGADEYAQKLPLVLRSFDDYKPALYAYAVIPFIKLLGLKIFSVRLVSALAGAGLVLGEYLLILALTKNKIAALIGSVLTVTSPILLLYSRIALEANLSLFLFVLGTALVFCSPFRRYRYLLGLLFLTLSMYAYHSPRYIAPIVVLLSLFTKDKKTELNLKPKLRLILFAGIFSLPILYFTLSSQFNTRFSQTSILNNYKILFGFNADLTQASMVWGTISRIYFYLLDIVGRYLGYFNPYQLFVNTNGHTLYHGDGLGVFNLIELPFWLYGIVILLRERRKYWQLILLFLIAPIPAAMTVDWFMPLRAILVWPFHLAVTTLGISRLSKHPKLFTKATLGIVGLFWLYQSLLGFETIAIYQPYAHVGDYQYGFAQIVPYINLNKNKYREIVVSSPHAQPHIFFAFFSAYPPNQYQIDTAWRRSDFTPRHNFNFGDYHFRSIYWPKDRYLKNTMFVGDTFQLPDDQLKETKDLEFIKDFYAPDGSISFRIVATKP